MCDLFSPILRVMFKWQKLGYNPNMKSADEVKILALAHRQSCAVRWHDGGGGEVHRLWDELVLFEIPQYGGEGNYIRTFHISQVHELLEEVYSWT